MTAHCIKITLRRFFSVFLLSSSACIATTSYAVEVGTRAPDFTLQNIESDQAAITLSDLSGKIVYVDFWASWCAPCLRSMPLINELYGKYSAQGFEVIAINVDDPIEDGEDFLKDNPVDYLVALDTDNTVLTEYGVIGMPTSYLIDSKGIVRMVHMGFKEKDIDIIEKELLGILAE
jgi:thiol-disulfide isomerase/thioredoxin